MTEPAKSWHCGGAVERPTTLGDLKASGYRSRSVREELRRAVIGRLEAGEELFPGIVGYEDTVIPQIVNAVLSQHHFILLGLRGQAKSRILRGLVELLDERLPILEGSEVNDDPLAPLSRYGRTLVEEHGDDAPIAWVDRDRRYVEKLATPDVTIADIIGDLDPIRAARGGHVLSDELAIHYGLLPRANRGIFALNELPDLSGKIQVALFNVMQEGDVQIKGFPVRLPLDVLLVFTANPEDYTARGKIITPLKDRVGSEIITHYPRDVDLGTRITEQEAWVERDREVRRPRFVSELIERIAFVARDDKRVDQRSGVSQRLPITVLENAVSNAERRGLIGGNGTAPTLRLADIYAALPAITGKLELEYEGELQGADQVARDLIARACAETFDQFFSEEAADPIVEYFDRGGALKISEAASEATMLKGFETVPGLLPLVDTSHVLSAEPTDAERVAACELVLEGLHAKRRISRSDTGYARRKQRRKPHFDADFGGPTGGPNFEEPLL
ncbi:MAG: sigma 54-interacting transcriptional regulator [Gemmatimonadota bacterium]|nr:sigma 54-interacting transcriptional regulator [Gemmatimonadota bacterium]